MGEPNTRMRILWIAAFGVKSTADAVPQCDDSVRKGADGASDINFVEQQRLATHFFIDSLSVSFGSNR